MHAFICCCSKREMNVSAVWCKNVGMKIYYLNVCVQNECVDFVVFCCNCVCVIVSMKEMCLHSLSISTSDYRLANTVRCTKTDFKTRFDLQTNLSVRHFVLDFDRQYNTLQWHAKQVHLLRKLADSFSYLLKWHHCCRTMNWYLSVLGVTVQLDASLQYSNWLWIKQMWPFNYISIFYIDFDSLFESFIKKMNHIVWQLWTKQIHNMQMN